MTMIREDDSCCGFCCKPISGYSTNTIFIKGEKAVICRSCVQECVAKITKALLRNTGSHTMGIVRNEHAAS